ncbi:hypothetical protein MMC29_008514 [Sticta canariensis]|nr:hypothetical protein [Sticta canariensis]
MVTLEVVRASNAKLKALPPGLVALFGTLDEAIRATGPKAEQACSWCNQWHWSEEAANQIISELKAIQPDGQLTFIKKDLTLIKNVDEVCDEIKAKEKKLNLLFMT